MSIGSGALAKTEGVEAKDDTSAGRPFEAQPLGTNGDAAVGADFSGGADAQDVVPPRASGSRPEGGTLFLTGLIPGAQASLAQFTVDLAGVAVGPRRIDLGMTLANSEVVVGRGRLN